MINYMLISNARLRQLIILSESMQSLPEDQLELMIKRIEVLPEKTQVALIAALEDEQHKIKAAKLAKGITPEMEHKHLEEATLKVTALQHTLESSMRHANEKKYLQNDAQAADNLIQSL